MTWFIQKDNSPYMVLFIYSFYFDEQQKQRFSVECFTVNMFWHSPQIPLKDLLHTKSF